MDKIMINNVQLQLHAQTKNSASINKLFIHTHTEHVMSTLVSNKEFTIATNLNRKIKSYAT